MDAKNWENPLWNLPGLTGIPGRLLYAGVVVIILDGNIMVSFRFMD
jgi:hypothetical protein